MGYMILLCSSCINGVPSVTLIIQHKQRDRFRELVDVMVPIHSVCVPDVRPRAVSCISLRDIFNVAAISE